MADNITVVGHLIIIQEKDMLQLSDYARKACLIPTFQNQQTVLSSSSKEESALATTSQKGVLTRMPKTKKGVPYPVKGKKGDRWRINAAERQKDGKLKTVSLGTFNTAEDASAFYEKYMEAQKLLEENDCIGEINPRTTTLNQLAEKWFIYLEESKLSPNTVAEHKKNYLKFIARSTEYKEDFPDSFQGLGDYLVSKITIYDCIKLIEFCRRYTFIKRNPETSELEKQHLKGQSINKIIGTLSKLLDFAIKNRLIFENVCKCVQTEESDDQREAYRIPIDDVPAFFVLCENEDVIGSYLQMVLGCLLRRGECLAIKNSSFTLHDGPEKKYSLTIKEQITANNDKRAAMSENASQLEKYLFSRRLVLKSPKRNSKRTIPVSTSLNNVIEQKITEYERKRLDFGPAWWNYKEGFLFTDDNGELLSPGIIDKRFKKFLKTNGLHDMRLHDLRHTGASLLADKGVPSDFLQYYLGHTDYRMSQHYTGVARRESMGGDLLNSYFQIK